ncbi:MAG: 3-hydroxyacyl-CoA dehydrogenase [Acetobacteraceae bacterium]
MTTRRRGRLGDGKTRAKCPNGRADAMKVAVIGCGLIGSAWAIVFARAGCEVALFDTVADAVPRAQQVIRDRVDDLERNKLVSDPRAVLAHVTAASSLAAALRDADYAQESVFETAEAKRAIFAEIDRQIGSETIVGSSSSGIPASSFTEPLSCRSRCLIAHPVNPPYLIPVVELVPAPWTAPQTVKWVRDFMERIGQKPVTMSRELEGFILNRLQGALLTEAWNLVAEGYASVSDVDRTVASGLGARWSFMGPFETIDLNAPGGVADYARRLGPLYSRIAASQRNPHVWDENLITEVERQRRAILPATQLQKRTAWRDRRLMALAVHKQALERKE